MKRKKAHSPSNVALSAKVNPPLGIGKIKFVISGYLLELGSQGNGSIIIGVLRGHECRAVEECSPQVTQGVQLRFCADLLHFLDASRIPSPNGFHKGDVILRHLSNS